MMDAIGNEYIYVDGKRVLCSCKRGAYANADERRYIHVTDFGARLDKSIHRKRHKERKAKQHKSLYMDKIIRPGTRMTRINRNFGLRSVGVCFAYPSFDKTFLKFFRRIFTDDLIRAHPCQPLRQLTSPTRMALAIRGDPRSIVYNSDGKISYQWHFSSIPQQEAAR